MELLPAGAGLIQSQDRQGWSSRTGSCTFCSQNPRKARVGTFLSVFGGGVLPTDGLLLTAASGSVQAGPGEAGGQGSQ